MNIDAILEVLKEVVWLDGASYFFGKIHEFGTPELKLENDGFKIIFSNGYWIRLYKRDKGRGQLCHAFKDEYSINSGMVSGLVLAKAEALWNEVTDALLAA